jgi:hypothetical protein
MRRSHEVTEYLAPTRWRYVYRAIDQVGQVIDIFVSSRRDTTAARRFFQQAIKTTKVTPAEVTTDQAATYPIVLDELVPTAWHRTEQYANNRIEGDHSRLKSRAATDARPEAGPLSQRDHCRPCLRPEPSSWALRAGGRGAGDPAVGGRGRGAGLGDLSSESRRGFTMHWLAAMQQHLPRSHDVAGVRLPVIGEGEHVMDMDSRYRISEDSRATQAARAVSLCGMLRPASRRVSRQVE